jgi:tRNA A37 threonylcarbamoyladenosine biosynthesis protein TsaE
MVKPLITLIYIVLKVLKNGLLQGFNDHINRRDITIIEWPEKAQNILCEPDIEIEILYDKEISRRALVKAKSKKGEMVCKDLV